LVSFSSLKQQDRQKILMQRKLKLMICLQHKGSIQATCSHALTLSRNKQ
jgi:hypothetical protein